MPRYSIFMYNRRIKDYYDEDNEELFIKANLANDD